MKSPITLILLLTLLCAAALAQTPKKSVAVYMGGGEPNFMINLRPKDLAVRGQ